MLIHYLGQASCPRLPLSETLDLKTQLPRFFSGLMSALDSVTCALRTGLLSLVTGHWSLVTGHWSLVTGHWWEYYLRTGFLI